MAAVLDTGERRLAILAYHKIGPPSDPAWSTWNYVPEEIFAAHLACLEAGGWQVIDLPTLLRGLAAPALLPEPAALLTFDDGYRSTREVALPWLERFGLPAVVFVSTAFIGGCNAFDQGIEPCEPICHWHDLETLLRHGVAVQAHGVSHRAFSSLGAAGQRAELTSSKAVLEARLGEPVEIFAYPYGDAGNAAEHARAGGYRAACLYGGGVNRLPVADPYRLSRLAMGPDSDLEAMLRT